MTFKNLALPMSKMTHYLDKERKLIRRVAYEKGVTEEEVRRVIGLELRDKLLEIEGLAVFYS